VGEAEPNLLVKDYEEEVGEKEVYSDPVQPTY